MKSGQVQPWSTLLTSIATSLLSFSTHILEQCFSAAWHCNCFPTVANGRKLVNHPHPTRLTTICKKQMQYLVHEKETTQRGRVPSLRLGEKHPVESRHCYEKLGQILLSCAARGVCRVECKVAFLSCALFSYKSLCSLSSEGLALPAWCPIADSMRSGLQPTKIWSGVLVKCTSRHEMLPCNGTALRDLLT